MLKFNDMAKKINKLEKIILKNVFFYPELLPEVIKKENVLFLENKKYRFIYQSIKELYKNRKDSDLPTLIDYMAHKTYRGKSILEHIGGKDTLENLLTLTPEFRHPKDIASILNNIENEIVIKEAKKLCVNTIKNLSAGRKPKAVIRDTIKSLKKVLLTNYSAENLSSNLTRLQKMSQSSKNNFLGLDTGFKLLNSRINGILSELYIIAGQSGMGKSSFLTQLAYQLAKNNEELNILFFSLDHSSIDITAKLISLSKEVPIDYVRHPYVKDINLEKKRKQAMEEISELKERFIIIDEAHGKLYLEDVVDIIKSKRHEIFNAPLVVCIDSLLNLLTMQQFMDRKNKAWEIINNCKALTKTDDVSIIATINIPNKNDIERPTIKDLLYYDALLYDPYLIFLIYCDYMRDFNTPFLEWEWESEDLMVPITELNIVKSKMSEFRGRLFYRFYNSIGKFKECVEIEVENYNAMIENIKEYEERERNLEKRLKSKVE